MAPLTRPPEVVVEMFSTAEVEAVAVVLLILLLAPLVWHERAQSREAEGMR